FETRCPNGKKVIQYKRAKLEKWAPYLNNNGLVCRLTTYEDLECTKTLEIKEWFQNREDMLELKHINKVTGLNIDYFKPGHPQALRESAYNPSHCCFSMSLWWLFQVEPMEHTKKLLYQPEAMMKLKNEEKLSRHQVLEILKLREEEEAAHELTISIYDTKRNEKSKEYREAMERVMHEEHLWQVEAQLDYLAPFLAQLPPGEKLTRWQAVRLKDECLSDFKQRLIDKANLIQARFEKETQELQKQQQWYQENQVTLTPEDEDLYLSYCSQAMFRIRILEQRLNRHKELAPLKYLALEEKLYKDPRLVELLKIFV
ncbi:Dynein regulatory complex subunit 7, partial [Eschrichtius robustus]|nr:Dynein regulatory complex subunit 7 [Eschrichtius robustus]